MKAFDAVKNGAQMVVADAREALADLTTMLADYHVSDEYAAKVDSERTAWLKIVDELTHIGHGPLPAQIEVFGALNEMMGDNDILINAAGSMPGDLQALWQAKTPVQYHVEYAFSTMGYEIPAGIGVKMACPESEVVSIVGDGTYQMLPMELATVAQEGLKVIYVLLKTTASHQSVRFLNRADRNASVLAIVWVGIHTTKKANSFQSILPRMQNRGASLFFA